MTCDGNRWCDICGGKAPDGGLLVMHKMSCPTRSTSRYPQTVTDDWTADLPTGVLAASEVGNDRCRTDADPADMVNHPGHYTRGSIECIDAIRAALGPDGFAAYCRGQVIKYVWRAPLKGKPIEDMRKARWYCERYLAEMGE